MRVPGTLESPSGTQRQVSKSPTTGCDVRDWTWHRHLTASASVRFWKPVPTIYLAGVSYAYADSIPIFNDLTMRFHPGWTGIGVVISHTRRSHACHLQRRRIHDGRSALLVYDAELHGRWDRSHRWHRPDRVRLIPRTRTRSEARLTYFHSTIEDRVVHPTPTATPNGPPRAEYLHQRWNSEDVGARVRSKALLHPSILRLCFGRLSRDWPPGREASAAVRRSAQLAELCDVGEVAQCPSVDAHDLARDERRLVRGQEEDEVCDVLWGAEPG